MNYEKKRNYLLSRCSERALERADEQPFAGYPREVDAGVLLVRVASKSTDGSHRVLIDYGIGLVECSCPARVRFCRHVAKALKDLPAPEQAKEAA